MGVEAPARQDPRSAHNGRMPATSNGARREASAARMGTLFVAGPYVTMGMDALGNVLVVVYHGAAIGRA